MEESELHAGAVADECAGHRGLGRPDGRGARRGGHLRNRQGGAGEGAASNGAQGSSELAAGSECVGGVFVGGKFVLALSNGAIMVATPTTKVVVHDLKGGRRRGGGAHGAERLLGIAHTLGWIAAWTMSAKVLVWTLGPGDVANAATWRACPEMWKLKSPGAGGAVHALTGAALCGVWLRGGVLCLGCHRSELFTIVCDGAGGR